MNQWEDDALITRLKSLRLHGCLANIKELKSDNVLSSSISKILTFEELERHRRLLASRIAGTKIKEFDPISGFDWSWPKKIDRVLLEELFTFEFLKEKMNVVFLGPAGVGKSTLAKNLVHEAARQGKSAVFVEAVDMLSELIAEQNRAGLDRLLRKAAKPELLAIDEVGYLSYDSRHADLLMRIIHMRQSKSSTIITTNRPFHEWGEMFPNSASVTALLDRLTENCEVVQIEGDSYRGKRSMERNQLKHKARKSRSVLLNAPGVKE
jgi:DNA replication protein DnaC